MRRIRAQILSFIFVLLFSLEAFSQITFEESPFMEIQVSVDTNVYSWSIDRIVVQEEERLPFAYDEEEEVMDVVLFVDSDAEVKLISLKPSKDFELVDFMIRDQDMVRFKVRFKELTRTNFLRFVFEVIDALDSTSLVEIPLFPITETRFEIYAPTSDLFIGEERQLQLVCNNVENVSLTNQWTRGAIESWIRKDGDELVLHLVPTRAGEVEFKTTIPLKKPRLVDGEPVYQSAEITKKFTVKGGRLAFLQPDVNEITLPKNPTDAIELSIDNNRLLELGKTYRIENQEEPGGALVAEIFTKSLLNNDKVLCTIRAYAEHRKTNGYLYLKDGDQARFITNLDITPEVKINEIQILRSGRDWVASSTVFPGETIDIRLEGEGLHKSGFSFPGVQFEKYDSLVKSESRVQYRLQIPIDIISRKIEINDRGKETGKFLSVSEYNRPKAFDFVSLEASSLSRVVSEIDRPIYLDEVLTDLVIAFNPEMIDFSDRINGKQDIEIDVRITNKQGTLVELYKFDKIIICPGESSPRAGKYSTEDCYPTDINLNNFIKNKTSDLNDWSRIELIFKHKNESYGASKLTKKVEIVMRRKTSFDIDVSFPAGLLIFKSGDKDFTSFSGISLAMIAQMSFYQPGRIAKYQPFKVGAGFIAIDAFNFSETSTNRDVGLVVLGSLYPVASERKLTFPLYLGFGYLLKEKKPVFMVGPGIRVRF